MGLVSGADVALDEISDCALDSAAFELEDSIVEVLDEVAGAEDGEGSAGGVDGTCVMNEVTSTV